MSQEQKQTKACALIDSLDELNRERGELVKTKRNIQYECEIKLTAVQEQIATVEWKINTANAALIEENPTIHWLIIEGEKVQLNGTGFLDRHTALVYASELKEMIIKKHGKDLPVLNVTVSTSPVSLMGSQIEYALLNELQKIDPETMVTNVIWSRKARTEHEKHPTVNPW